LRAKRKPAISPAFSCSSLSGRSSYRRLRAPLRRDALRAALFLARVRAPLRADALRAALLLPRVPAAFLAADLRPRFLAAAMLSLHDEVRTLTSS